MGVTEQDELIKKPDTQHELLVLVWGVLRGVVVGAHLDSDYANQLSEWLDEEFDLT